MTWRKTAVTVLAIGGICALIGFTLYTSISPLTRWMQNVAACPGAEHVTRETQAGPNVPTGTRAGDAATTSTTTSVLVCTSGSQTVVVGNDEAFVKGALFSLAVGAAIGVLGLGARRSIAR